MGDLLLKCKVLVGGRFLQFPFSCDLNIVPVLSSYYSQRTGFGFNEHVWKDEVQWSDGEDQFLLFMDGNRRHVYWTC